LASCGRSGIGSFGTGQPEAEIIWGLAGDRIVYADGRPDFTIPWPWVLQSRREFHNE